MRRKRWLIPTVVGAFLVAMMVGPGVSAHHQTVEQWSTGSTGNGGVAGAHNDDFYFEHHDQHGPSEGHLPGSRSNVDLLGQLKLTNFQGDISDVSATQAPNGKWYAYVGDWGAKCQTGGVHVVDISNPANPVKVGFLNAGGTGYQTEGVQALHIDTSAYSGDILVVSNEWCLPKTNPALNPGGITIYDINDPTNPVKVGFLNAGGTGYQTEGVQALHIDTSAYSGDILVVSNEWCLPKSNPSLNPGGITIYDINDPTNPVRLVQAFGDFDLYGNRANEAHSAIAWDAGRKAYVAAIDNEELEDVDLFEITNPRSPRLLAETNLPGVRVNAYGSEKTSHDFDVLKIGREWHLMVSDWDAGWIDVNVTNPANPQIVGDFDYAACDQVVATACPPEGNAHQGEWNSTGSVFIGTDEDQSPFRLPISVVDGPLAGQNFAAGEFSFTKQVASFPDGKVNGPTVFGGYGCPDDTAQIPPASALGALAGEEKIIVFQRGPVNDPNHPHDACFFSDKIRAGEQAGYDAVIVANHHVGSNAGEFPDAFACGSQGSPVLGTAAGLCVGHRFMHEAFGTTPDYTVPYPSPAPNEPTPGTRGPRITAQSQYDGWGYARLVATPSMTEVGQFAIPPTSDPAFASGFGDMSVHEVEVPRGDPDEGGTNVDTDKLAYFSWYAAGFRVVNITNPANPVAVGHYVDPAGNNFWGVALAEDQSGNRIVLASDRDFGLFIFRYTGPTP